MYTLVHNYIRLHPITCTCPLDARPRAETIRINPLLKDEYIVNPFSINADPRFSKWPRYKHLYAEYDWHDDLQPLHALPQQPSPFWWPSQLGWQGALRAGPC